MERGLPVYVRRSRGDDIDAACGQLAGEVQDRTQARQRMAGRRVIDIASLRPVHPVQLVLPVKATP